MKLSEMDAAIQEAETELRRADMCATKMAKILVGRLRHVAKNSYWDDTLIKLKRELTNYNAHTRQWK